MEDRNTRIVVFGRDAAEARALAEAAAREAFHNVAYFPGILYAPDRDQVNRRRGPRAARLGDRTLQAGRRTASGPGRVR